MCQIGLVLMHVEMTSDFARNSMTILIIHTGLKGVKYGISVTCIQWSKSVSTSHWIFWRALQ